MKKVSIIVSIILTVFAFYVGNALQTNHPMDQLFYSMVDKMNDVHVIKFKSGFAINVYDVYGEREELQYQWQMKREGEYDAWSKYLHFKNVLRFENDENNEVEDKTSLSFDDTTSNLTLLPIKETYYKNNMYFTLDRKTNTWSYKPKEFFDLIELLPFNAEVLNRYATYYKSDNRGKYVVFFFSINPNYLTRTFKTILESENYDFPYRFREGTIKTLVYPDSNLPKRIYAIYVVENLETNQIYRYHVDTYFSEDKSYEKGVEPAIPDNILQNENP